MTSESLTTQAGSAMFLLLGGAAAQAVQANPEVLLDPVLRILCFGGAIGGGFMALAFFPKGPRKGGDRGLRTEALRWLTCSVFGGVFSPFLIEQVLPSKGFSITASSVLATSAFMGLFAWSLVEGVQYFIRCKFKGNEPEK